MIRRALPIRSLRRYRLLILALGVVMEHDAVGSCSRTQPQTQVTHGIGSVTDIPDQPYDLYIIYRFVLRLSAPSVCSVCLSNAVGRFLAAGHDCCLILIRTKFICGRDAVPGRTDARVLTVEHRRLRVGGAVRRTRFGPICQNTAGGKSM